MVEVVVDGGIEEDEEGRLFHASTNSSRALSLSSALKNAPAPAVGAADEVDDVAVRFAYAGVAAMERPP